MEFEKEIRRFREEFLTNGGDMDGCLSLRRIGYSVCFSERRKGIATFMLSKMLPLCREIGMEKILVTCPKENEGSRRVIKNNGGIYEDTLYEPSRGVFIERYRIDLSKKIP